MISAQVETIGPEQAAALLAMNTGNFRKPDMRRVNAYAKEMAAGKWSLNGDTIKLNGAVLLDGQHRLMAIVKSKTHVPILVVRGLETDGKTIDRGKPRTIAQWCAHQGIKNATNVAATARLVVLYNKGFWAKTNFQVENVVDSEIFEFIAANNEILQPCIVAAGVSKSLITQSLMAAVLYVGCDGRHPGDVDEATWFCKALSKGEALTDVDAVFHLRNRLIEQKPQARLDQFMKRALLTIAWNKTVTGQSCNAGGLRLRLTGPAKQRAPSVIETVSSTEHGTHDRG